MPKAKWVFASPVRGYALETKVTTFLGFTKEKIITFDNMWDAIGFYENDPTKRAPIKK